MSRKIFIAITGLAVLAPLFVFAQVSPAFSRQGIFGCSRNAAALNSSVGAFSATGGVYVPVADYTVELNTGTLVYLQCVLRGIVDRESEAATAALVQKDVQVILTGNDGGPMFRTNPRTEMLAISDRVALRDFQNYQKVSDPASPDGRVLQVAAKSYMAGRQGPQPCPYQEGSMDECRSAPNKSQACIEALQDPSCSPLWQSQFILHDIYYDVATENANINAELVSAGGFYGKSHIDPATGDRVTETPSGVIEANTVQALTSGFRRVETANDVDQMVGALYAGLGTQTLSGSGGLLTGLTSSIGSGASYLSQMTAESNAGLRNAAANAALQILASARTVEAQYNQVVSAIANSLTNAANQLRGMEKQCWDIVIYNTLAAPAKHVCASPPTGNTCVGVSGANLTIATSSLVSFAQLAINASIAPVATQAAANADKSKAALALIDQLIQAVSNTSSLDAQRLALVQLDQLVSQGKLHVAADVTAVQQQQSAVADAMAQLVDQKKTSWTNDTFDAATVMTTGVGWCNVNDQAVIDFWDSKWR